MSEKLRAGQEVRVHTPRGTVPGTVTYVGRKLASIRYNGRLGEFDMQTRRSRGHQVGTGTWYEVPAADPEQERFCAALDVLEAHGITIIGGADVTPDQVEAIAAILRAETVAEGISDRAAQLVREWDAAMHSYSEASVFVDHQPTWLLSVVTLLREVAR